MIPGKINTILLVIVVSLSLVLSSCGEPDRVIVQKTKIFMGTTVQIKISLGKGADKKKARDAIDKAFAQISKVDRIFSVYKPDSEVSRINRLRKNEKLQLSKEAFDLIKKSIE